MDVLEQAIYRNIYGNADGGEKGCLKGLVAHMFKMWEWLQIAKDDEIICKLKEDLKKPCQ